MAKFLVNRKTSFGTDKSQEAPPILQSLIRVIEKDMAPTLLVYFLAIVLGTFYVIAAVFAFAVFIVGGVMVIAYLKNKYKMIAALRIALVLLTFAAFLIIFIDDMFFMDNSA